jgi:hypothetical protein
MTNNKITCDFIEEALDKLQWDDPQSYEEYLYDRGVSLLHVLSDGERGAYKCYPGLTFQEWKEDGWPRQLTVVTSDE